MKKKFLALLSLSLVTILALFSGCSGASILTFENKFYGESNSSTNVPAGYVETVTYNVKNGEYGKLKKDSSITDEVLTLDINGTFTTKLLVYDASLVSTKFSEEGIETDLVYADKGRVYYYETNLQLTANYVMNGEQKTSNDTIISKSYFLDSAQSLSPIWSKTNGNYSYLITDYDNKVQANQLEIEYTTTYNKNTYSISQNYRIDKLGELNEEDEWTKKSHTYAYTPKTLIDNTQLLFAIRNIKTIEKDSSTTIPTLSPVYGVAKTLSVKNVESKTETLNNFNGNLNQLDVPVTSYEFYVKDNNNTGVQKYVSVQNSVASNAQGDNLLAKAHVIKYVEPLSLLGGSFPCVGALIYTISSVK